MAIVADLRAAALSTAAKAHAVQRPYNYPHAPLLLAIPCCGAFFLYLFAINMQCSLERSFDIRILPKGH